jgi:NADH dehydrogenase
MLAITGANGNLGRRLLAHLAALTRAGNDATPGCWPPVRALVRSAAAARRLEGLKLPAGFEIREVDYLDVDAMTEALAGCSQVVHLVGIIKPTAGNRYEDAHERTCEALAAAARRCAVDRIVYLSILGAAEGHPNACLRSRAAAENVLLAGTVEARVLRVPMVLGEGDYAARALAARARRGFSVTLRAQSLEQPIYAGDVIEAICALLAGAGSTLGAIIELAGPESLSRRALTQRAAATLDRRTRVLSLPLAVGLLAARVFESMSSNPPVTRDMLGILDHDDCIDAGPAAAALGIALTPLDIMLRNSLSANDG